MYPYIVPYLPTEGSFHSEEAFFFTGAGFAEYPSLDVSQDITRARPNIGASLRRAVLRTEDVMPIERRFVAILNADREDLTNHLWQIVTFLKYKDMQIDWRQFLHDLALPSWDAVRREWAVGFWGPQHDDLAVKREVDAGNV